MRPFIHVMRSPPIDFGVGAINQAHLAYLPVLAYDTDHHLDSDGGRGRLDTSGSMTSRPAGRPASAQQVASVKSIPLIHLGAGSIRLGVARYLARYRDSRDSRDADPWPRLNGQPQVMAEWEYSNFAGLPSV